MVCAIYTTWSCCSKIDIRQVRSFQYGFIACNDTWYTYMAIHILFGEIADTWCDTSCHYSCSQYIILHHGRAPQGVGPNGLYHSLGGVGKLCHVPGSVPDDQIVILATSTLPPCS